METGAHPAHKDRSAHNDAPSAPELFWHTLPSAEAAQHLGTDLKGGLTAAEAGKRLAQYGPNQLATAPGPSWLSIFLAQFKSLIVLLLAIATAIAFALKDFLEGISILVVILANAFIGFFTEARAQRAIAALKQQAASRAQVVRDGKELQVPGAEVVPGDLVVLSAGMRVPADGRIIESAGLQLEEAALTGESRAVDKGAEPLTDPQLPLADRTNMAFLGTTVTNGRGLLLVTATAASTEVGKIGKLIEQAETEKAPLEKKLAQLGRAMIVVVLALCAVIAIVGRFQGHTWLEMFKIAVSLAVAAVPEGLPAVATVTLALGMQRMARQRALIRHLAAVETLGSTTVICADKTGTLTRNEMMVVAYDLAGEPITVTGSGYQPEGEFRRHDTKIDPPAEPALVLALRIGALCNDANLDRSGPQPVVHGDPTEGALIVAAEKAGLNLSELRQQYPRLREIPFRSETKRMVTVHRTPEGKTHSYVKGSPGTMLERCSRQFQGRTEAPLAPADRDRYQARNVELASGALRILGLAWRELPGESADPAEFDRDLVFVGLVGLIDPLREEAKPAIATCRAAGIRIILLTGDQPPTAETIAQQLELLAAPEGKTYRTVHARELDQKDKDWRSIVREAAVFARVTPEHKLRIVEALQTSGEIVAMTGDGVNDAPALKKANIGIAMGIKGTDVAKEAADMIITDDNFASIAGAVEQGRVIYRNI